MKRLKKTAAKASKKKPAPRRAAPASKGTAAKKTSTKPAAPILFRLAVHVTDLDRAVSFYSRLLGIEGRGPVLLFCGSIEEIKGVEPLLAAWHGFHAVRPEWRLLMVGRPLAEEERPSFFFRRNFVIITAGVCDPHALRASLATLGEGNVMFSVDYPYQESKQAGDFIASAPLADAVRAKVCTANAQRVLHL